MVSISSGICEHLYSHLLSDQARRHRKISLREIGQRTEATARGEELNKAKQHIDMLVEKEDDIKSRLEEFHVHPDVLLNEAGISENDGQVEGCK